MVCSCRPEFLSRAKNECFHHSVGTMIYCNRVSATGLKINENVHGSVMHEEGDRRPPAAGNEDIIQ
jgi:hypothetical protein